MNKPTLLLSLVFAATAASAAESPLKSCRAMSDERARLACYDAIPLDAAPAPAAKAAADPVAAAASFGLPAAPAPGTEELTSRIVGDFKGWEPRMVVRLENGQQWEITDQTRTSYALKNPKVTIKKSAFGGYTMDIEGVSQRARVRRVK